MSKQSQLQKDLAYVFNSFPLSCLHHFRTNSSRLVRGVYSNGLGGGCIMYLLSETLPAPRRINSRTSLVAYFARDMDEESPEYQPAKWVVRLWDNRICTTVKGRYGQEPSLNTDELLDVLDQVIAEREARVQRQLDKTEATVDRLAIVAV